MIYARICIISNLKFSIKKVHYLTTHLYNITMYYYYTIFEYY